MKYVPNDFEYGKSTKLKLERVPKLEIKGAPIVERLPFQSNGFYFTHNYWLNSNTLILNSCVEYGKVGHYNAQLRSIIFKCEFLWNKNSVIITRLTSKELNVKQCVLSHDKKILIILWII